MTDIEKSLESDSVQYGVVRTWIDDLSDEALGFLGLVLLFGPLLLAQVTGARWLLWVSWGFVLVSALYLAFKDAKSPKLGLGSKIAVCIALAFLAWLTYSMAT